MSLGSVYFHAIEREVERPWRAASHRVTPPDVARGAHDDTPDGDLANYQLAAPRQTSLPSASASTHGLWWSTT